MSGAAVWSLSLLVSCVRSLVWRVSLSDVAIPQVMLSSHFNFYVYLRIPSLISTIWHHHFSLRTFAPAVSSYNKMHPSIHALPAIRLPHLHLTHPWYRPIVNLIRTIRFHTFEVPRAGLSFTLDPHPPSSLRV